jgi:hypothetical protein
MIRAAFLKRMAFAALASALIEVRAPAIRWAKYTEDDLIQVVETWRNLGDGTHLYRLTAPDGSVIRELVMANALVPYWTPTVLNPYRHTALLP